MLVCGMLMTNRHLLAEVLFEVRLQFSILCDVFVSVKQEKNRSIGTQKHWKNVGLK